MGLQRFTLAWRLGLLAVALAGCSPKVEPPLSKPVEASNQVELTDTAVYRGAGIAHLACVQCHNIGVAGAGPGTKTAAPDFEAVANREGMTAAKIETWLRSSHPTMPGNYFGDATVSDLAAYIMYLRSSK